MYKRAVILCTLVLFMGCSVKSSSVQTSALTGATVGTLAGAVMGATLAFSNGDTGNKMATKVAIFGVLVGLAGAGIGSTVAYTKEIFGGDKEEKEANQQIYHAIAQSKKPQEKIKIYNKKDIADVTDKIQGMENAEPKDDVKIYNKKDIVDITKQVQNMENNSTKDHLKIHKKKETEDMTSQVNRVKDEPIDVSSDTKSTNNDIQKLMKGI